MIGLSILRAPASAPECVRLHTLAAHPLGDLRSAHGCRRLGLACRMCLAVPARLAAPPHQRGGFPLRVRLTPATGGQVSTTGENATLSRPATLSRRARPRRRQMRGAAIASALP